MISSELRDIKYIIGNAPKNEILRQDLIKNLKLWVSLPNLSLETIEVLKNIRSVIPLEDRKLTKLFNEILQKHKIKDDLGIAPYDLQKKNSKFKFLLDQHPPHYLIPNTHLKFFFKNNNELLVEATLTVKKNDNLNKKLILQGGKRLKPITLKLNGEILKNGENGVEISPKKIVIPSTLLPEEAAFTIETSVWYKIDSTQTRSGIFIKDGWIGSLCEPAEFKNITYFIDRPDNPTYFSVEATLNKKNFPVFLTNGNLISSRDLDDDLYCVNYQMNEAIPSYLFGCAAGHYEILKDNYITKSGRSISLEIYCKPNENASWIFDTAKSSLKWFEDKFSLEYRKDLLKFASVHVSCYGMENEGLIFLKSTLVNYFRGYSPLFFSYAKKTVAHEIFHHYSGNNPTIPSMFYSSFKEGLTRYLDMKYAKDHLSDRIVNFEHAKCLNLFHDFLESRKRVMPLVSLVVDQDYNYSKPNEFYSLGREIFSMLELIFGEEHLIDAIKRLFIQYEGKTAAFEELFVLLNEIIIEKNLPPFNFEQFSLWLYELSIPTVHISMQYLDKDNKVILKATQFISENKSFIIPIVIGFLNEKGQEIMPSKKMLLTGQHQELVFENISEQPIPSLFRGISAPVKWQFQGYSLKDLSILIKHDTDEFNRYRAMKEFWGSAITLGRLNKNSFLIPNISEDEQLFKETILFIINDPKIPYFLKAKLLNSCKEVNLPTIKASKLLINLSHIHRKAFFDLLNLPLNNKSSLDDKAGHFKLRKLALKLLLQDQSIFKNVQWPLISGDIEFFSKEASFIKEKNFYNSKSYRKPIG